MNVRRSLIVICFLATALVKAEITLPGIFTDAMVLQRQTDVLL